MATKAEKEAAEEWGPSPYQYGAELDKAREERERQERLEKLRARKATHPHMAAGRPNRPDLLAIPEETKRRLAAKGLEATWIGKHEWPEYAEKGYKQATDELMGCSNRQLRHDYQSDPAQQATTVWMRREMLLVVGPKKWREDRMREEQALAASQMGQDPLDMARGRAPGEFGRRRGRPSALEFVDKDDRD